MPKLNFFSRVAFLCNVIFLIAVSLRIFNWLHNEDMTALILIIGYCLAVLFNPLVTICYLVLWILKKGPARFVPVWLITSNVIFLILQVIYILYLNDTSHT